VVREVDEHVRTSLLPAIDVQAGGGHLRSTAHSVNDETKNHRPKETRISAVVQAGSGHLRRTAPSNDEIKKHRPMKH
jgi:hypothetical protein